MQNVQGIDVEEREGEPGLKLCHDDPCRYQNPPPFRCSHTLFFEPWEIPAASENLKVFLAYQGGKTVAFHLILRFKDLWISEYSGNTDEALNGVNQLLYWDTIKRAYADGARTFSFGRTSASQ